MAVLRIEPELQLAEIAYVEWRFGVILSIDIDRFRLCSAI